QEELVLDRREAHALGLSFAPAQEPAQSRTQLEKCLIVGILDSHIVLRYRYAICLARVPCRRPITRSGGLTNSSLGANPLQTRSRADGRLGRWRGAPCSRQWLPEGEKTRRFS